MLRIMNPETLDNAVKRGFIAGSTLKGMVRSVTEALSNSCLGVVDLAARFSWRYFNDNKWRQKWPTNQIRIGCVEELPHDGQPGKIAPANKALVYFDDLPTKTAGQEGDEATAGALVDLKNNRKKAINVTLGHSNMGENGYLKIAEIPENSTKKSQRLVYGISPDQRQWLSFDETVEYEYNQANEAGREIDARQRKEFKLIDGNYFKEADENNPSRGLRRKRHKLEVGDFVYYLATGTQAVRLGPAELSRVLYDHGVSIRHPSTV